MGGGSRIVQSYSGKWLYSGRGEEGDSGNTPSYFCGRSVGPVPANSSHCPSFDPSVVMPDQHGTFITSI